MSQAICNGMINASVFKNLLLHELEKKEIPQVVGVEMKRSKKTISRRALNKKKIYNPMNFTSKPFGWKFRNETEEIVMPEFAYYNYLLEKISFTLNL